MEESQVDIIFKCAVSYTYPHFEANAETTVATGSILAIVLPAVIVIIVLGNIIFRRVIKPAAPVGWQSTEMVEMAQQIPIATVVLQKPETDQEIDRESP